MKKKLSMGTDIPIFTEYYPHTNGDCYKMYLPYTKYRSEKIVLGTVDEGFEAAKAKAKEILVENITEALDNQETTEKLDDEEYFEG